MGRKKNGKKADPSTDRLQVTVVERTCVCEVHRQCLGQILDIGAERERILSEARAEAETIVRNARDAAHATMSRAARRKDEFSVVA